MRQKCHLHGYPRRADARRCECQQPLSVAARAHMHSPWPTTSPEHRQMRFPRAPAHYPAIPATDPADFALFGVPGALGGEVYPNEKLLIAGLPMAALPL